MPTVSPTELAGPAPEGPPFEPSASSARRSWLTPVHGTFIKRAGFFRPRAQRREGGVPAPKVSGHHLSFVVHSGTLLRDQHVGPDGEPSEPSPWGHVNFAVVMITTKRFARTQGLLRRYVRRSERGSHDRRTHRNALPRAAQEFGPIPVQVAD